ncbi:RHS repeat-associated core domain-containing protein, partial [Enterobacter kobei]
YQPWAGRWLSADPAGTVDGLNLFRMCRNNPVTFNDLTGTITNFNYDFKGLSALNKGLESLSFIERSQYGTDHIMEQLEKSSEILGGAIQRLEKRNLDKSTKKTIRDVFAFTSSRGKIKTSRFKEELKNKFIEMKKSLDWNIANKGEELRFLNDPNSGEGVLAYVYPKTPAKKNIIYLSEKFVKEKNHYSSSELNYMDNLATLIHEVSHFQNTEDYFYAAQPKTTNIDEYFNITTKSLHNFNKIIGTADDPNLKENIAAYSTIGYDNPAASAKNKFYEGKSRLKIALNNADHIAVLALRLGHPSRISA